MKLVLTGGGTGGHVYPALEVGRVAALSGAELHYFGSHRGREKLAATQLGIPFEGFPSEPLYSLRTLRGLRSALKLKQSQFQANKALRLLGPDVVFSTGGYSGGPVVAAARDLRIPYVLHSIDSNPARSLSMFAQKSSAFTFVFQSTPEFIQLPQMVRTGQPIRPELRALARSAPAETGNVLFLGGSQGSVFLNELALQLAPRFPNHAFTLVSGEKNYDELRQQALAPNLTLRPFLSGSEMGECLASAMVVLGRSGGSLAEWAVFGTPSILIPLPNSANDHQLHNAKEFVKMGAASLINQADASAEFVSNELTTWLTASEKREAAFKSLKEWDMPEATDRIVATIFGVSK